MSGFKLTWRLGPELWLNDEKWQDYMKLITKHEDVADEVAFFFGDDTFLDCTPLEDTQRQADVFERRAKDIHGLGRTIGINVWPTFDLYEGRRKYYPDMPRMVSKDGARLNDVACPSSEEFLSYIREKYLVMAKARPDFIWVDDDCRFTHLGSGGYPCFCDTCVKNFENGRFADRQALVDALNRPENEALRVSWSSYGADRLAHFCEVVRAAVDEVDPAIDTPFMSVGATHTTFSGDYIDKCMKALRSRRGRPGHFFWNDKELDKMMWKTMEVGRQTMHYPDTCEDILWEEDSHPQTQLNKSMKARRNEVSLAMMAGCTGIAFNHQNTNPRIDERLGREVDELHEMRPLWEKYYAFSRGLEWGGMWPIHSWFMAAHMDCENGWFQELSPDYSYLLSTKHQGAASDYDITIPEKIGTSGVALTADDRHACAVLMAGKTLHALSEEELKKAFSGCVIMDKTVLKELEKMGLGKWAGVKLNENVSGGACYAVEHPFNGPFAGYCHSSISTMAPAELIPLDGKAETLAVVRSGYGSTGGYCCISKYENELGGKVIVDSFDPWYYVDEPHKLYLYSAIAEWFGAPLRLRWPNPFRVSRIQPYVRTDGKRAAVLLVNASLDASNPVEVLVRGSMTKAVLVNKDGSELPLTCEREGDCLCIQVPSLDGWEIGTVLAE